MQSSPLSETLKRWRRDHKFTYDSVVLTFYLAVLYAWTLTLHPLGRDYALLAGQDHGTPALAARFFHWEVALFGSFSIGYHLVNILLLYGCLMLLYRLTNRVVGGKTWLGNFAAVLFLANPVHTESVLNLSGSVDLLPCLLALAALVMYVRHAQEPAVGAYVAAMALFAAALLFPINLPLLLLCILLELLIFEPAQRNARRLALPALLTLAGLWLGRSDLAAMDYSPANLWAPLYLIFYPIGYLPETAQRFHEQPWLGWLAAATALFTLYLILRKARRASIVFAVLAMFVVRLVPGHRLVDPVHLVGGGQLLLANAFFTMAVAALFWRMMDHVRWRPSLVAATTFLGLLYFGLQIHSNLSWSRAADAVVRLQADAAGFSGGARNTVGLLPDYRYHVTAPACYAEALAHDTPFSKAVPATSLLPLHRVVDRGPGLAVEIHSAEELVVTVDRAYLQDAAPWPYDIAQPAGHLRLGPVSVDVLSDVLTDPSRVRLRITSNAGPLPKTLVLPTDEF